MPPLPRPRPRRLPKVDPPPPYSPATLHAAVEQLQYQYWLGQIHLRQARRTIASAHAVLRATLGRLDSPEHAEPLGE